MARQEAGPGQRREGVGMTVEPRMDGGELVDGCVCVVMGYEGDLCSAGDGGTPELFCTRPDGHDGLHVACGHENHRLSEWGSA